MYNIDIPYMDPTMAAVYQSGKKTLQPKREEKPLEQVPLHFFCGRGLQPEFYFVNYMKYIYRERKCRKGDRYSKAPLKAPSRQHV